MITLPEAISVYFLSNFIQVFPSVIFLCIVEIIYTLYFFVEPTFLLDIVSCDY